MKKAISILMILAMLLTTASASISATGSSEDASAASAAAASSGDASASSTSDASSPKEEAVYGILEHDGSVKDLYVVNIFNNDGSITDYGSYSEVRNLTTSEKLVSDGDRITINTTAKKFYYQGTLQKKELPWEKAIKYNMDDKQVSAGELAGKSGRLKIAVSVKRNDKANSRFSTIMHCR